MNNSDPRLSDFINKETNRHPRVRIIGFPSDRGVIINGGRPGASKAPALIFEHLIKLTPHPDHFDVHQKLLRATTGIDNINCSGQVEKDQVSLGKVVSDSIKSDSIPLIIGGGHETSFGHFLGYADLNKPVHILNIDAHTDVRELKNGKAHSGSPFRQAIEHKSKLCKSYNVFGLNPASVSHAHFNFVRSQGTAIHDDELSLEYIRTWLHSNKPENLMITMDMDAVQQSDAPGVSAANASGITKHIWLDLAFELGRSSFVTSFDLCEVNPDFDRDNQTTKLAALTIWWFLLGVALRE